MNTIFKETAIPSAEGKHSFNTKFILRISFISALGGYLFGFDFAVI